MAGRQRHLVDVGRVPGGDDQPARIRIALDHLDDMADLVDGLAVLRRPRAPLLAVDRPEVAALVGPFVPDAHAVLVEIFDVGVAGQEPEQLVDDRFEVQLLGGEQRKAVVELKAHLMAEHRERAGAGAVVLFHATAKDMFHQVEVLAHRPGPPSASQDGQVYCPRQPQGRRLSTFISTARALFASDGRDRVLSLRLRRACSLTRRSEGGSGIGHGSEWGKTGHSADMPLCPLMTQSGHGAAAETW